MLVLGVHFYGHDCSAALVYDGKLIDAVEEERLSRLKHDKSFPSKSIAYILKKNNLKLNDIDLVSVGQNHRRLIKEKYFNYTLRNMPKTNPIFFQSLKNLKFLLNSENYLRKKLRFNGKVIFQHHHKCHLASAHFSSGFETSNGISIDGIGDIESTYSAYINGGKFEKIFHKNYPHSLGLMYTSITQFLGFTPNSSEGSVMALASFGDEKMINKLTGKSYRETFEDILFIKENELYRLNLSYFNFPFDRRGWVSEKFIKAFGKKRNSNDKITNHHKNIASALQSAFERAYINIARTSYKYNKNPNLTLAGGCALNCVANGKILEESNYKKIFIQPASNDAGVSIGAAYIPFMKKLGKKLSYINKDRKFSTYLGPSFNEKDIEKFLIKEKVKYQKIQKPYEKAAKLLKDKKVIGWFQGKMEFGPRALGNRSILANPSSTKMRDYVNKQIKHRESFRPFAPAVLEGYEKKYFKIKCESNFMLFAVKATNLCKKKAPAIIHVDGTCRVQTVSKKTNINFYSLLKKFNEHTNIPLLLNTSFNDRGEPIVCSPEDALNSVKKTGIKYLFIDQFFIDLN